MKKDTSRLHSQAFTLIELSIVIVLIGVLVGGVVSGKTFIRASQLRSLMVDTNTQLNALNTFRNQYRYLPGDLPTATKYWPPATFTNVANGNADGLVLNQTIDERFQYWQQLGLSGLIDSKFTGAAGAGGADDFVIGQNVPESHIAMTGFSFYYANMTATTKVYTMNLGNMLAIGSPVGANAGPPISAAFTPTDAYTVDMKVDDGLPGAGKWVANGTGGGDFGTTSACTLGSSGTDYTSGYQVTNDVISCGFFVMTGY